jgi:hypothetical protein
MAVVKPIENAYLKAAALITLIGPLHLAQHPAEHATTQEAIAALREIPIDSLRAASITRLAAALNDVQLGSQAVELIASESKNALAVISLESSLAESRIGEAWGAAGHAKKSREHFLRAVYAAQRLQSPLFQSIAFSAAGLSAGRVRDKGTAFFACEGAYRAASSLNSTAERDLAYGRVLIVLAELYDVPGIATDFLTDSIYHLSEESLMELTERITADLLRKGVKPTELLLPASALGYSVSAETLADLGRRDEARNAVGLSEYQLTQNPADDRQESRIRMHLAIAYARLGEITHAVDTANRCRSSSDRLTAFAGIVKAYAPQRWFVFRIWSGI